MLIAIETVEALLTGVNDVGAHVWGHPGVVDQAVSDPAEGLEVCIDRACRPAG